MAANPQDLLTAGDPVGALKALQQTVRANAADVKQRIFLFQLLCVLGQWQRALDQLKVCGELDASALVMVNTYDPAIRCEAVREAVFGGRTLPHVFGPPSPWVALLAQALQLDDQGQPQAAAQARAQALDQAEPSAGLLGDTRFEWLADADSRLGPTLEVIINGRYGWLPFSHLKALVVEPVADLRDLVWAPAHLRFHNGGDSVALLPVRYAGTPLAEGGSLALSRQTDWLPLADGQFRGVGQRLLSSDAAELGLLEVKTITFDEAGPAPDAMQDA